MSISAFQRMTQSVLSLLGQDAFLRTTVACKVNIERSVQVAEGDMVYERDIATIDNSLNPTLGDRLSHPFGEFVLDRKFQDNGFSTRFIVRPYIAPPPAPTPAP